MTTKEATRLVATLMAAFPKADPPAASVEAYYDHLLPLPIDQAQSGIDRLVAGVDRAEKAQPFFPSIPETLSAIGLNDDARRDLARIKPDTLADTPMTGQLLPSLRSMSGWEIVETGSPVPDGVALYYREAKKSLPPGVTAPVALPSGPPAAPQDIRWHRPPAGIVAGPTSLRSALGVKVTGRTLTSVDHAQIPEALRPAAVELERSMDRLQRMHDARDSEALALRELRGDIEEELAKDGAPLECAKPAARRLLQRIAATDPEGAFAAVQLLAEALYPGLEVAKFEPRRGPKPDDFDDALGPVEDVRIQFKRIER